MSHEATNWAVKQRGIPPAAKLVLWHLCDRHNPDHGCFPMQSTLADDCEMSRSSLNNQLSLLENAGLIRRVKRSDPTTKRQKSTRYILGFESEAAPNADSRVQNLDMEAVSKKQAEPCPKSGHTRVQTLDTNLVIEPVIEPVNTREALCSVLRQETADAFIEHRKAKRAKLTPKAVDLIVKKLAGCPDPDAVVEASIMNGWTGIFPEKGQNGKEPKSGRLDDWAAAGRSVSIASGGRY